MKKIILGLAAAAAIAVPLALAASGQRRHVPSTNASFEDGVAPRPSPTGASTSVRRRTPCLTGWTVGGDGVDIVDDSVEAHAEATRQHRHERLRPGLSQPSHRHGAKPDV